MSDFFRSMGHCHSCVGALATQVPGSNSIAEGDADIVIENLDLSSLSLIGNDMPNLSPAELQDAKRKYRHFLKLLARYPQQRMVPTKEIDLIWHAHLLDLRKYTEDCQKIFGCFLHHVPRSPAAPEHADFETRADFTRTAELWETEFSSSYI